MCKSEFTYYSSQTEAEAVTVRCRDCGKPMATAGQQRWREGDYYTLATCESIVCELRGYTFSANGYEDVDLDRYRNVNASSGA